MKNNFLNNNGANLRHTSKKLIKKTQVENRIDELKEQEQAIIKELNSWKTKQEKVANLPDCLTKIDRFSTDFLTEAVKVEKNKENRDDYRLEHLIKNKVEFSLKFEAGSKVFYQLIFQKIESQISYLKSQLGDCQSQLSHQERLFARIEIRRQGRILLDCKLNNSVGCLGVYRCDNCRVNYSVVDNNQATEMQSIPGGQISQ